ncbi:MAG: ABC transporter ATP-binding protein [Caulobacterales bacterium]
MTDALSAASAPEGQRSSASKHGSFIARLWRNYATPHLGDILLLVPALIVIAAAGSAYAFILQITVDRLNAHDYSVALWGPLAIIAATGVRALAIWTQIIASQSLGSKVLRDLQRDMYAKLMYADFARFSREGTGALISRFGNDIGVVSNSLVRGLQVSLRDALMLIGAIGAMIYFDWMLTLYAVAVFLLAAGPLQAMANRARRQTETMQVMLGALTSFLAETLSAPRFIITYGLQEREKARAQQQFDLARKLNMKLVYNRARAEPLMEVLGGLALAGVVGIAAWRISCGEMTIGDLLGIVTAVGVASPAARSLGSFNTMLNEAFGAMGRIFGLIDEPQKVIEAPGAKPLAVTQGALTIENVSFTYGDAPALRNVSFTANKGERIALVGPSGAGKSTIFNLVPRLYDVTGGGVLIDGQDIRHATLPSVRGAVALVAQESVMFNDTIRANIALGKDGATDSEIEAAAKLAAAHDFIVLQPEGYDTIVGERGGNLSGGERQRIALARAFLRDAPILLLDEATSALDSESEAKVQEALNRLCAGRTTLIIAHRLATVRDADRILVMENGEIVESGKHDALVAKGGLYARLHALQFRE